MWNATIAKRLDAWYATAQGEFALRQEYRLFQRLVSSWPRRGHTLLDVGCGTGVFLEMLWEYGFEVTGLDDHLELLNAARKRLGLRVDLQFGKPEHLPYDDKSLDYVSLISTLEYVRHPQVVLEEAMRVARRGVLLGFMNRWSAYCLWYSLPGPWKREKRLGRWLDPLHIARMAKSICPHCGIRIRSVLPGLPSGWRESGILNKVNTWELLLPLGAYVGMRIDTQPCLPLTPLPLRSMEKTASDSLRIPT